MQRIKLKQLDHLQYQYLYTVLELLTGAKNNCKNWPGKQGNCCPSMAASTKGRYRLLVIFPENRDQEA
jgi:hypothetical protein